MQINAALETDSSYPVSHPLHTMWKSPAPSLLTLSLDAARRKALQGELGQEMERAKRFESPLDVQLCLRRASRRIARNAFSPCLLDAARKHLASGGVIVWDGLPVCEPLPAGSPSDALTLGQALAAVVAQATTHSFGFIQEDGGRHFQRLYPVEGLVNSGKTIAPLLPHVDNCMLAPAAQPQVIHLVCVNNEAEAATNFLTIDAVLRGLLEGFDARVVERLFEPAYLTSLSNSFAADAAAKSITTRPRPILYRRRDDGVPTRFLGKAYDMSVKPGMENRDEYEHRAGGLSARSQGTPGPGVFGNRVAWPGRFFQPAAVVARPRPDPGRQAPRDGSRVRPVRFLQAADAAWPAAAKLRFRWYPARRPLALSLRF